MGSEQFQEYDDAEIAVLELVWGQGYLSPGGPDEIKKILDGVELAGKEVLDIGCGTGGIDEFLAATFGPARIVGIDVEANVIERARKHALNAGHAGILEFQTVEPGPLQFEDATFDVVFSKDAIVHIPNKEALFQEIIRVLRPGGIFAASDWMSSTDGPFSEQMNFYIEAEGFDFGMGSPARYQKAMAASGFTDIKFTDRNAWYKVQAHREYNALSGPLYGQLVERVGKEFADHHIELWRAMTVVVDSGELRPGHMRGRRPG